MRSPLLRRRLAQTAWLAAAVLIAAAPSRAAETPPVLLVVPAGCEVAKVEAARAFVPPSRALLTVGAAERIPLKEGLDLVVDRSFSDAPPSDLIVVLVGEAAGLEEFLVNRRRAAKAILFLGESPLVKRLKADGSRGALILVGSPEAIVALAGAETAAAPASPAASSSETPRAVEAATPRPAAGQKAAPSPSEGVVRRFFSAKTPTPTPPGRQP